MFIILGAAIAYKKPDGFIIPAQLEITWVFSEFVR